MSRPELIFTEHGLHTYVAGYENLNMYDLQILVHHFRSALSVYDENGRAVENFDSQLMCFHRGHTPRVANYFHQQGFPILWRANYPDRLHGFDDTPPAGELRGLQEWAVQEMCKHAYGIVRLATRFGKSYMYAGWYARVGRPRTLILVHKEGIAKQMRGELEEFLGEPVGIIARSTGLKDNWQRLTIGIDKSFFDDEDKLRPDRGEQLYYLEALIRDECHNCGALGYDIYNYTPNLTYSWGGSATPFTKDAVKNFKIEGLAGPIRAEAKAKLLAEYGLVAYLHCYWIRFHHSPLGDCPWHSLYHNSIVNNSQRNKIIADTCTLHQGQGLQGIVFVDRVEHGKILNSMIPGSVFVSSQTMTPTAANRVKDQFNAKQIPTVITTKKWREGITFYADYAFNAEGMSADHVTIQKAGRPLMPRTDGKAVLWYDFIDFGEPRLHNQSLNRWECMEDEGWTNEVING